MWFSKCATFAELQLQASGWGMFVDVLACALREGAERGGFASMRQKSRGRSGELERHVVVLVVVASK